MKCLGRGNAGTISSTLEGCMEARCKDSRAARAPGYHPAKRLSKVASEPAEQSSLSAIPSLVCRKRGAATSIKWVLLRASSLPLSFFTSCICRETCRVPNQHCWLLKLVSSELSYALAGHKFRD